MTLTAQPWALTREHIDDVARQGLDDEQIETAVGVVAMFNYLTRVADATGIEFDYPTPLPAFEPDRCHAPAARPARPAEPLSPRPRRVPRSAAFAEAWEAWRHYLLESDQPLSRRERGLAAATAAEEAADWETVAAVGPAKPRGEPEEQLVRFARALSRQPWSMQAADLDNLRSCGYSEQAILHIIAVTAHQNAASRLHIGLSAAAGQFPHFA